MLCNDKVLVLVHHQQSAVVDLASIVLHPKAVRGPFGGIKPWHAIQLGSHCMCQVLQATRPAPVRLKLADVLHTTLPAMLLSCPLTTYIT